MKWPKHKIDIGLSRRVIGNEEHGFIDVYQLDMNLTIGENMYIWALYIIPEKIKDLQKYVNMGIAVCWKKINEMAK